MSVLPLALLIAALGYALVGSLRARQPLLALATIVFAYVALATALANLPRPIVWPLGPTLARHMALLPSVLLVVASLAARHAFRLERTHEEGMPRQAALHTAGFAFLALAVLSAMGLLITGLALAYVKMSGP